MSLPMRSVPVAERPREKLLRLGPEALTDTELVAILLQTGTRGESVLDLARRLLQQCKADQPRNGLIALMQLRETELKSMLPGIGPAKRCQILAALHLGQRASSSRPRRVNLSNPREVYRYLIADMADLEKEKFMVMHLNAKNNVIDVESVSVGTLTASLVHPREIFKSAIRRSSHAIILVHNHPSGDPTPSREDREVTQRLIAAGKLVGIEVLDHLIVGSAGYTSFREQGLMA